MTTISGPPSLAGAALARLTPAPPVSRVPVPLAPPSAQGEAPAVAAAAAVRQLAPDAAAKDRAAEPAVAEGEETAQEAAPKEPPGGDRPARYRYNVRFIDGLVRPLVELVDTESDRRVYSYPPEHLARLLERAHRLGGPSAIPAVSSIVDASA